MRSRLFRTMGASLSLAASIALSTASTQALGGPGQGAANTQTNLAQGQASWFLGGDPSELTSSAQQDTTGQLGVDERNESDPFALSSGVDSGGVAQANVALGSAQDQAAGAQSDATGDATLDQSTTQTLIGQDSKRLRNESQPIALWSHVDSGDVAQANVERGNASNASATQQSADSSPFADLPSSVSSDPGSAPATTASGDVMAGARPTSSPDQVLHDVVGSLGMNPNRIPDLTGDSQPSDTASTLAATHDLSTQLQASQDQPTAAGSSVAPASGSDLGPTSSGNPSGDPSSTTTQTASGQVGPVQVDVNAPVAVLSRVQSGDVQQANVAVGRASNQSRTSQSDPNDPTQSAVGQDTVAQVNVNAPVAVLSRVQSGDVAQANVALGQASNRSHTEQQSSTPPVS
jgi:hypothetical protein